MDAQSIERASLAELEARLTEADALFQKAREEANAARRAETNALTRLNDCQKAIDQKMGALKKTAANGSDWTQRTVREG